MICIKSFEIEELKNKDFIKQASVSKMLDSYVSTTIKINIQLENNLIVKIFPPTD